MRSLIAMSLLCGGCSLLFGGNDLHGPGSGNLDLSGENFDLTGGGGIDGGDMAGGGGGGDMTQFFGCGSDAGASMVSAKPASYPTGSSSYDVAVGDFDGDGWTDVAVSNTNSNNVSVLWNQKNGTFSSPMQLTTVNSPKEIAAVDLNGDGHPDIAVACDDGVTPKLAVLLYVPATPRTFAAHKDFTTAAGSFGITAADFNKDGKMDVATVTSSGDTARIFLGDGTAGIFPTTGLPNDYNICPTVGHCANGSAGSASGLTSADVNKDGYADIITANNGDNSLSVLLNDKAGKFPPANVKSFGATVMAFPFTALDVQSGADVNGDGFLDLVYTDADYVVVAINDGKGGFPTTGQQSYDAGLDMLGTPPEMIGRIPITAGFTDFNGDGLPDIVSADFNNNSTMGNFSGNTSIFLGRPGGTFAMPITTMTSLGANSLRIADFNNDCRPDFVIPNRINGAGTADVWLNKSTF